MLARDTQGKERVRSLLLLTSKAKLHTIAATSNVSRALCGKYKFFIFEQVIASDLQGQDRTRSLLLGDLIGH